MSTVWGDETKVSEMRRTVRAGIRCDVCGRELAAGKDYLGWGVPKGWYRVETYTGYSTEVCFADACSIEHLTEIARDVGRYMQMTGVRIYGEWTEVQKLR